MRFRDLSLSVTIPIRVTAMVVATAVAVTAILLWREYEELRRDLANSSASLGSLLATSLVAPLTHDDLWRAFEIARSPVAGTAAASSMTPRHVTVLDAQRKVYVSSDPLRFPHGASAAWAVPFEDPARGFLETAEGDLLSVTAVTADGVQLGFLVLGYSNAQFQPRFADLLRRAVLGTAAVLAVLLPLSWLHGRRTAAPLLGFAREMERIGRRSAHVPEPEAAASGDELARVGESFRRMVAAIEEKERLERQVVVADRLAAIGRVAAGVAHEINNPLGGMLNALNTYRRHGQADPVAARTADLLERGLLQIRDTVRALLVEAQAGSHPLTREDVEDARTLALTNGKAVRLRWHNDLHGTIGLPSTLVRQVLLNLLLNAEHAVGGGGEVGCRVGCSDGRLRIVVCNDGAHIAPERLPHLFEPFAVEDAEGRGLGLWVTYQIVRELGGSIAVQSAPGNTEFDVCLPVPKAA
jgi:two-component system, NtrC family, sensor kinase